MLIAPLLLAAAIHAAPIPVNLDELRTHPGEYDGRIVRTTGQIDECWNMSCHLCPVSATPADPQWERCLAIGFDRFRGGERNRGADMDSAFRYADVVVTARFDPSCLQRPGEEDIAVCTDRATVLRDARVEKVTHRRRSRDGLIRRPEPLLAAPEKAARQVLALVPRDEPGAAYRVFATPDDPLLKQSAVLCRAEPIGDEAAEWPTSWQGALTAPSTEDRYHCRAARLNATGWVLDI